MKVPSAAHVARIHEDVLAWFDTSARDLPWRGGDDPWAVLVSELMLQQTPVARVLPVFEAWMQRWPAPSDLAAEPVSEAVRAWGRLGYPRRAQRLHAAAVAITRDHDGQVPADHAALLALPGVGEYTAAAVASFAFGQRHVVLDTNVRRVLARVLHGAAFPAPSVTASERRLAASVLPGAADGPGGGAGALPVSGAADGPGGGAGPGAANGTAHRWAAATMELGALVCTARAPRCGECPVSWACRWRLAGYPAHEGPPRRGQAWAGTDRQCRGRLMAVLRDAAEPVAKAALDAVWDDDAQRERCLDSLLDDGLATVHDDGRFSL